MKLRLLPEAEEEIRVAAQWYQERENGLGDRFIEAIVDALVAIEDHPRRFANPPRSPAHREVRRYLLSRFPFAVVYEIRADETVVLAVAHARRRPRYWRGRLR